MKKFLFESVRCKKVMNIAINEIIHEDERQGLGNYASIQLNKQGGFFIYLLIEALKDKHIEEFNNNIPEFRIFTKGDKSYMLVQFAPNFPISEFLFDVTIYKNFLDKQELGNILSNTFKIALVDNEDNVKAIKSMELKKELYDKFENTLLGAFDNPDFSREYRVFLLPFYEKSTDRWWNIIEE